MYYLIIDKSSELSFNEALVVSFTCILVVLAILAGSSVIISLLRFVPSKKEDELSTVPNKIAERQINIDDLDDDMMAATLVALIDAAEDEEDATYRLKSIKKI